MVAMDSVLTIKWEIYLDAQAGDVCRDYLGTNVELSGKEINKLTQAMSDCFGLAVAGGRFRPH